VLGLVVDSLQVLNLKLEVVISLLKDHQHLKEAKPIRSTRIARATQILVLTPSRCLTRIMSFHQVTHMEALVSNNSTMVS